MFVLCDPLSESSNQASVITCSTSGLHSGTNCSDGRVTHRNRNTHTLKISLKNYLSEYHLSSLIIGTNSGLLRRVLMLLVILKGTRIHCSLIRDFCKTFEMKTSLLDNQKENLFLTKFVRKHFKVCTALKDARSQRIIQKIHVNNYWEI